MERPESLRARCISFWSVEDQLPPAGDGFFFLVRGVNRQCPAAGSPGAASGGTLRGNTNPAACPLP